MFGPARAYPRTSIESMLRMLRLDVGENLRGIASVRAIMCIYKELDALGCTAFEAAIQSRM
jgi:hypothetical protein